MLVITPPKLVIALKCHAETQSDIDGILERHPRDSVVKLRDHEQSFKNQSQ